MTIFNYFQAFFFFLFLTLKLSQQLNYEKIAQNIDCIWENTEEYLDSIQGKFKTMLSCRVI